ncbi:MAG: dienelactone hydrolase family protein [Candidatus Binataceae bacterium]
MADAYGGLQFLGRDPRIESKRIALLAFGGSIATAAIFSDTIEAQQSFPSSEQASFRAFFAFYPYCNVEFTEGWPRFYAPGRIFIGEKDDMEPADRCVQLAGTLRAQGADMEVTVYAGAEAGFDLIPPDANYPLSDRTALHPGAVTVSTHPQYSPWSSNFRQLHTQIEEHLRHCHSIGCRRMRSSWCAFSGRHRRRLPGAAGSESANGDAGGAMNNVASLRTAGTLGWNATRHCVEPRYRQLR